MIKIDHITFGYNKKQKQFTDFSLKLEKGKIYGLLGKNGAGKSTLLYLISGLLIPLKGNIYYEKHIVAHREPDVLKDIFIVPEEFDLPDMTLKTYVKLNAPFYPNFSNEDMCNYLTCFDMNEDLNLKGLSMGQKKKVFLSFALATNTSLLIMDEPTNGLDIPSKSQFRKFMALGMSENKTFIISTHQVQDVNKMLDHIIIIEDSNLLLNETVAKLTSRLNFVNNTGQIADDDVIYSQPTPYGNACLVENMRDTETPLDLELLYGAVLNNNEKIKYLLNK